MNNDRTNLTILASRDFKTMYSRDSLFMSPPPPPLALSAELDNRAKEREAVNEAKNEVVRIGQDLDGLETTLNAASGRRRRRRNLNLLQELTTALINSGDVLLSRNVQKINSLSSELAALRGRLVVFNAEVAAGASGLDVPALLAGVGSAKQTAQNATKVARQELADIEVEIQVIVVEFENSGSTVPPLPSLEPEPTVKPVTPTTSPTTPPPTTPNVPTTIAPSTTASPPTPTTAPPSPGTSTCSITREYCSEFPKFLSSFPETDNYIIYYSASNTQHQRSQS